MLVTAPAMPYYEGIGIKLDATIHGYDGGENGVDGGGRNVPGQGNVGGGLAQDQQLVEISHQRIGDHIENQPAHSGQADGGFPGDPRGRFFKRPERCGGRENGRGSFFKKPLGKKRRAMV